MAAFDKTTELTNLFAFSSREEANASRSTLVGDFSAYQGGNEKKTMLQTWAFTGTPSKGSMLNMGLQPSGNKTRLEMPT